MAVVLALTAPLATACGSSSNASKYLIPRADGAAISRELAALSSAVSAHSCARANAVINNIDDSLAHLSPSVSQRLAQNLGEGASEVKRLALTDCRHAPKPTKTTSTSTTITTSSTPTTQTTTTTPTTQTTTTTQTTNTTPSTPTTATQPTTQSTPTTPGPGSGSGSSTNGGAGLGPGDSHGNGHGNGNGQGNGGGGQ